MTFILTELHRAGKWMIRMPEEGSHVQLASGALRLAYIILDWLSALPLYELFNISIVHLLQ